MVEGVEEVPSCRSGITVCVSSTYIDDDKVAVYPQRLISSMYDIITLASLHLNEKSRDLQIFTGRLCPNEVSFQTSGILKGREFHMLRYMQGFGNLSYRFILNEN